MGGKTFPHPQVILQLGRYPTYYFSGATGILRLQINVRRYMYMCSNTGVEGREIQTKFTIGLRIPSHSDTRWLQQVINNVSEYCCMHGGLRPRTSVSQLHETQAHTCIYGLPRSTNESPDRKSMATIPLPSCIICAIERKTH